MRHASSIKFSHRLNFSLSNAFVTWRYTEKSRSVPQIPKCSRHLQSQFLNKLISRTTAPIHHEHMHVPENILSMLGIDLETSQNLKKRNKNQSLASITNVLNMRARLGQASKQAGKQVEGPFQKGHKERIRSPFPHGPGKKKLQKSGFITFSPKSH